MKPISLLSISGNGINFVERVLLNKLNEVTERVNELSGAGERPETADFRKLANDLFEHLSSKEPNGLDPLDPDWIDNWLINNK